MVVIRDPITLYFSFDWPKDFDENLKHEVEFMIKSNESLAENKKTNKHVALQNLSVYYTWKNVRKQYKNNKR